MKEASPWPIYRRLLGLSAPYRGVLAVALVGLLLEGLAAGAFGLITKPMVDETFVARNSEFGLLLPLGIVAIFVVRGIAGYIVDMEHEAMQLMDVLDETPAVATATATHKG